MKKGQLKPVTRDNLSRRDYYRAQINLGDRKYVWAFGYGALRQYDAKLADAVREYEPLVEHVADDVSSYLRRRLEEDADFRASIEGFITSMVVGPDVQAEARRFFENLGWTQPPTP